jgi:hypothetical protein
MMKQEASLSTAQEIMLEFADATGLSSAGNSPRRYLWTDAFAVCTFLTLDRQTSVKYKLLALRLINQVHGILGRHRQDDRRTGWLSGLDDRQGATHPTRGGLRIGKAMNERSTADPFDDRREWDRDGQYYHYLTKWMHSLNRAGRVTGETVYNHWAIELAKTVHARFTYTPPIGGRKRMYWKMSIDLSRPLVLSMGPHDPLDGLVTYSELQEAAHDEPQTSPEFNLDEEIADLTAMCQDVNWTTDDPLGLGGLLSDAYRVGQLMVRGHVIRGELLADLLSSSLIGLESLAGKNSFALPVDYRLAFREFGLSIGLHAVGKLERLMEEHPGPFGNAKQLHSKLAMLMRYERLIETIEQFWIEPANRKSDSWTEHRDINGVMLATSLAPDGFLTV